MKLLFALIFFTAPLLSAASTKPNIVPMSGNVQTITSLNPIFFQENKLNPLVREQLIQLGDRYFSKLKQTIPDVELVDMAFAGNLAGYHYNNRSAINLQLMVDAQNVSCDENLLNKFIKFISQEWQEDNIPFANYTVNISIRTEIADQGGVYSLLNDKWLHTPALDVSTKPSTPNLNSAATDETGVEVD